MTAERLGGAIRKMSGRPEVADERPKTPREGKGRKTRMWFCTLCGPWLFVLLIVMIGASKRAHQAPAQVIVAEADIPDDVQALLRQAASSAVIDGGSEYDVLGLKQADRGAIAAGELPQMQQQQAAAQAKTDGL